MTVGELIDWCSTNNVPETTELSFDRGIDLVETVGNAVYHNGYVLLIAKERSNEDASITA